MFRRLMALDEALHAKFGWSPRILCDYVDNRLTRRFTMGR